MLVLIPQGCFPNLFAICVSHSIGMEDQYHRAHHFSSKYEWLNNLVNRIMIKYDDIVVLLEFDQWTQFKLI